VGQSSIIYRDVTAVAPATTHFPEWVVAFENLGFVRLGRVQGVVDPGGIEALAADYTPEDRALMIAAEAVPTMVMAAPDGSAFADVDWFWGGPSVRIRTLTTDGRLLATDRGWEYMPAWPVSLRSTGRYRSLAQEQRLPAARGRSLEIVADADAATLWERHRVHLARRKAVPEPHDALAGYIRLAERAFAHEERSADRSRTASFAALVLVLAAYFILLPLLVPQARTAWGFVVVLLGGALLAFAIPRPLVAWVRYLRWIRPRFR
jgi:hypothetical protein